MLEKAIHCEQVLKRLKSNTENFLKNCNENIQTNFKIPKVSKYIQGNRYYPEGVSDHFGKHDNDFAPHLVDILDAFHPNDPAHFLTVMKSTQSMITTTGESGMAFWIKHYLGSILFVIATEEMAKIRASSNIDVMLDHTDDLKTHIDPHSDRNNRKIKDSTYKELTANRILLATSYNATSKIESVPYSLLILSELDRLDMTKRTAQLDPEASLIARTTTKRIWKLFRESSPSSNANQSRIFKAFKQGDQREFYVPCPDCNEFQVLKTKTMGRKYGLTFDFEKFEDQKIVIPNSVRYICKFCQSEFFEKEKPSLLKKGKWIPKYPKLSDHHKSWHLSALISPVGFYSWERVCQDWMDTDLGKDIFKLKDFVIRVLGEPWHHRKQIPDWKKFVPKGDTFRMKCLPKKAGLITVGVDIQANRIESMAVAWGDHLECWVIDYQVFYGSTSHFDSEAYQGLFNYYANKKYDRENSDQGIYVSRIFIDARWANKDNTNTQNRVVYDFCYQSNAASKPNLFCPIMGVDVNRSGEILMQKNVKDHPVGFRYDISTSVLKDELFNFKLSQEQIKDGLIGSVHFPNFDDQFFKGFFSEVLQEENGKWRWTKIYERNEPLDVYIYARSAAESLNVRTFTKEEWLEMGVSDD